MARVIGHLVQNAIEACAVDGNVQVLLQAAGAQAQIQVTDNGRGMDETFIREKLFRPFATTKSGGMGIGVYECREYVLELKGEMKVTSTLDVGSTFTLSLPQRHLAQPELEPQSRQGANGG